MESDVVTRVAPSQMGFCALIKDTLKNSLAPSANVSTQQKDGYLGMRKQILTKSADALMLDIPASRSMKNKFLLYVKKNSLYFKSLLK